ncbi:MAG TPA: type III polyketide synthase [Bacteroidota bacterium]|nr:type III polyketide synthase [Bacteroidota bacterium]
MKGTRMIIDIATASPPYSVPQAIATQELIKRMGARPAVARLIEAASAHSGIATRQIVIPDAEPEAANKFYSTPDGYVIPDTKTRMDAYETWSRRLSCEAVQRLFASTGCDPSSIERLIVISCTGFFAPGLDSYLVETCGIPRTVKRTTIGFMGCAASLIGFTSAMEALSSTRGQPAHGNTLLVSVELCSLHLQTEPTRDNILANMIFADGAAAVLFSNNDAWTHPAKLDLLATESIIFSDSSALMGWKIGNTGFEMMLSSDLPKTILEHAIPALHTMLSRMGVRAETITHWVLHPGGRAILDALQQGLCLSDEAMQPSRTVLNRHGNMSSASILFVLREMLDTGGVRPGDFCCAVAFGPGLSMEVAVMKGR